MAYHPQSKLQVLGKLFTSAGQGVLSQRGPYANPIGGGLAGPEPGSRGGPEGGHRGPAAGVQGPGQAGRDLAGPDQGAERGQDRRARGRLHPGATWFSADNKELATAPEDPMTEAEKQRLEYEPAAPRPGRTPPRPRPRVTTAASWNRVRRGCLTAEQNRATREQAAATAAAGKTADERIHNAALGYSKRMAKGEKLSPDELLDYRDKWKTLQPTQDHHRPGHGRGHDGQPGLVAPDAAAGRDGAAARPAR